MKRAASLWISVLMILILLPVFPAKHAAAADLSETGVRNAMLALKAQYPDGTRFDNSVYRSWNGGIYSGGYGCAGFAFMLSDAAFGSLPAREYHDTNAIRVGDILRLNNNGHSVIVLYVNANSVTVAEGNMNGKVLWGREVPFSEIRGGKMTYALTRYPQSAGKGDLNGDAQISADDAQIVLQAYVYSISGRAHGLSQAQFSFADINGNGRLDVEDAQNILRYYVLSVVAHRAVSWAELVR